METKFIDKIYFSLIIIFSFLLFLLIVFQNIAKFEYVNNESYDLAIYTQSLWLLQNSENYNTVRNLNIWAHHFQPILYPISWLFKFLNNEIKILLIFQASIIIFFPILCYFIASKFVKLELAFLIAIAALFYPALQNSILFDFHIDTLALPLFWLLYYFLKKEKISIALILTIIISSFRENFLLPITIIALILYYSNKKRSALIIAVFSFVYFILIIFLIKPYFAGGAADTHLKYYSHYGDSAVNIFLNIFLKYKLTLKLLFDQSALKYYIALLLPLFFIPLVNLRLFVFTLPLWLINLLSNHPGTVVIDYHFQNELIPVLFVILLETKKLNNIKFNKKLIIVLSLFFLAVSTNYSRLFVFNKFSQQQLKTDEKMELLNAIKKSVKDNDSVCADLQFVAHFALRKNIYVFPDFKFGATDWLILSQKNLTEQDKLFFKQIKEINKNNILEIFEINDAVAINFKRNVISSTQR